MRVQIVSMMGVLHGAPAIAWTGDVPDDLRGDDAAMTNTRLLRYFNRLEPGDGERLARLGYDLPSPDVGDLLHWDARTWRAERAGFTLLTGEDELRRSLTSYLA